MAKEGFMDEEHRSILTLALMAAFSDRHKADAERDAIKKVAEALSPGAGENIPAICQDILLGRITAEQAVRGLTRPETRQLAYEMAVCVCDSDGEQTNDEKAFLTNLSAQLGLDKKVADQMSEPADALVAAPLRETVPAPQNTNDPMILNYSILNGALELLPDSLSSLAIIPLQMKMVYRIGKSHGFELDRGHIKDFIATAGVGLTSQYLEKIGSKIIGKVIGKAGGKILGGLGHSGVIKSPA
jgi:tellurite resistance protein